MIPVNPKKAQTEKGILEKTERNSNNFNRFSQESI